MLDATNEKLIRKAVADSVNVAIDARVIPAALYLSGREDFIATFGPLDLDTRDEIEEMNIAACWVYPLQFADNTEDALRDNPQVNLTYEFYLFRQYDYERSDEAFTPDSYAAQRLKRHDDFIADWLGIRLEFIGNRNISGLPVGVFSKAQTTSILQAEAIENRVECEFIKGVFGFAVRLQETVEVLTIDC